MPRKLDKYSSYTLDDLRRILRLHVKKKSNTFIGTSRAMGIGLMTLRRFMSSNAKMKLSTLGKIISYVRGNKLEIVLVSEDNVKFDEKPITVSSIDRKGYGVYRAFLKSKLTRI